jgi:MoaA/NifB/PqqE/SkfB family radical SAM enzyme
MQQVTDSLYEDNLQLAKAEYLLQRIHLRSRPRMFGLVLSNRCNLGCVHCYQAKNADNLLTPVEIGRELRRELSGFYPYLSTLDLLGGEIFLDAGFSDLVDDVAAAVRRPMLRITTNGTLLDEDWAERIVRTPFRSVTISIDGGTSATYAQLRRGGDLDAVLNGIRRIQKWKQKLGSEFPSLDSFFVIMRSNFREIPEYLELMRTEGVGDVALQTLQINAENTARTPTLVQNEFIASRHEVLELHGILREALRSARGSFRAIRLSGLATLFASHGLDGSFLREDMDGLYPESDDLRPDTGVFDLCPNPWTTMFVTESGNVHLCFLSEPIGNLYETPLTEIWNSPQALAKRSRMISGRYIASACSEQSCSWREGRLRKPADQNETRLLLAEMKNLAERVARLPSDEPCELPAISSVRRLVTAREQTSLELEGLFRQLCETNSVLHKQAQDYIDHLESELRAERRTCSDLMDAQKAPLVRIAMRASRAFDRLHRRSS